MTRIAHLTDLHILEEQHHEAHALRRLRLGWLSFGRPLDAQHRRFRLARALERAWDDGADHVVLTGDLTEDGTAPQFEALGHVLDACPFDPMRITVVPGNHDAYTDGAAFARALRGPLSRYAATSAPGAVTVYDDVTIVAGWTAFEQPLTRSAGRLDDTHVQELDATLSRHAGARRAMVLAMHHPPLRALRGAFHWVDGLQNDHVCRAWLERYDALHVLHGHTHRAEERTVVHGRAPQIYSALATAESDEGLRSYDVSSRVLVPTHALANIAA